MSKLNTYRVSYHMTEGYHIEVEASSPKHAAEWAQTLLDRNGVPLHSSENIHSEYSVYAVEMASAP